jgi:isopentenyl diphosphate isomerase/L-lactate dehydrogenase-like FMN-dependent dehydrogenase
MTTLPPLSAASSSIVNAIKQKAMQISMTGDFDSIAEGYRICSGLAIRSALELASGTGSIRAEDVIDNLRMIADNLDPEITPAAARRAEGRGLIEMLRNPDDYSADAYDDLLDAMNSLLEQLTEEE